MSNERQTSVLLNFMFHQARGTGVTARDVTRLLRTHHGVASGLLSRLERDGVLLRLETKRNGQRIYVRPEDALGRPVYVRRADRPLPEAIKARDADDRLIGEGVTFEADGEKYDTLVIAYAFARGRVSTAPKPEKFALCLLVLGEEWVSLPLDTVIHIDQN